MGVKFGSNFTFRFHSLWISLLTSIKIYQEFELMSITCYNAVVLRKISKIVKNCSFLKTLCRKKQDQQWSIPKIKSSFFPSNNKKPKALNNVSFDQNITCFDWVMNDFLSGMIFCFQNWSFLKVLNVRFLLCFQSGSSLILILTVK